MADLSFCNFSIFWTVSTLKHFDKVIISGITAFLHFPSFQGFSSEIGKVFVHSNNNYGKQSIMLTFAEQDYSDAFV